MFRKTLILLVLLTAALFAAAQKNDHLVKCWEKMVKPLQGKNVTFTFKEELSQYEHSFEPWQQTKYNGKGNVWMNASAFLKHDTLSSGNRVYTSKTQFNNGEFLFLDHGDQALYAVTKKMVNELSIRALRYSPVLMISHFHNNWVVQDKTSTAEEAVYRTVIDKTVVFLAIRKSDNIALRITTQHDDDLFGDVETIYSLNDYAILNGVHFPKRIDITKINGKIQDVVTISQPVLVDALPTLLEKPVDYSIKEDVEQKLETKYEKFSNNIHLLELKHTDDRVLIVEFKDFLLVAEAPINSRNGDLILQEAKKIAPNKPVKYFVFGHYHPHYIGGVRPFVHAGAEIISSAADRNYVEYIVKASHKINPDKLQREPKSLKIKEIKDSLTVTDGSLEMKIYVIGKKSEHTNDYLIYYFPKEKLLFEDDLVWIAREGEIKKAGRRQAGLYHAIKDLGLQVETIIQSWPVQDYGVKTIIPFADLEKSMSQP